MSLLLAKIRGILEDEDLGNFVTLSVFEKSSSIGSLSIKYDPDAGDTLIFILGEIPTTTLTLHNTLGGGNLQVPIGKKWRGAVQIARGGNNFTYAIWESNTLDTADGTQLTLNDSLITNEKMTIPFELAAQKFLTFEKVSNNGNVVGGIIVESNA